MLRFWVQRLGLILAGILIAFAIAETTIRVFNLAPVQFYTYDRYVGWKLKPGASGWQTSEGRALIEVNRDGFRGPDYPLKKPPGTLRIAVLGDSFTEAQQVALDDTFCAVAQHDLQAQCPFVVGGNERPQRLFTQVEVINFGCDGYGTAQELLTLRHWVWRYSPDVVVLAFFNGNDVRNNSIVLEGDRCRPFFVHQRRKLVLDGPFEDSWAFRIQCMMRFESRHSQVLNLMGSGRSQLRQMIRAARTKPHVPLKPMPKGVEPGLNNLIYGPPANEAWREAWSVTDDQIDLMNREVTAHGALFLVATFATGIQDDPDHELRIRFMRMVHSENLVYPDDHLRDRGQQRGFAVINLPKPMQEYAEVHQVYLHGFPNTALGTGHWNEDGHRVAGTLLGERIRQLLDQSQSSAPEALAPDAPAASPSAVPAAAAPALSPPNAPAPPD
jgi:hypothetical protein